jgi:hypothetical protein
LEAHPLLIKLFNFLNEFSSNAVLHSVVPRIKVVVEGHLRLPKVSSIQLKNMAMAMPVKRKTSSEKVILNSDKKRNAIDTDHNNSQGHAEKHNAHESSRSVTV